MDKLWMKLNFRHCGSLGRSLAASSFQLEFNFELVQVICDNFVWKKCI